VPVKRFNWRGAFGCAGAGRGAVKSALEVSGWAVEPGEVFLRFSGYAISSAFCSSVGSAGAAAGGGATELEAEVWPERGGGGLFSQVMERGAGRDQVFVLVGGGMIPQGYCRNVELCERVKSSRVAGEEAGKSSELHWTVSTHTKHSVDE
jgi:hypothetical protein